MVDTNPITVDWLHSINWLETEWPEGWNNERRGISYSNWTIHSMVSNGNYDDGPFVWTVMPTHGQNMIPLERRPGGGSYFTILVLEDREDVKRLLRLLERKSQRKPHEPCANPQCTICAGELRAQAAYDQSMSDLAASGGIVDAP